MLATSTRKQNNGAWLHILAKCKHERKWGSMNQNHM